MIVIDPNDHPFCHHETKPDGLLAVCDVLRMIEESASVSFEVSMIPPAKFIVVITPRLVGKVIDHAPFTVKRLRSYSITHKNFAGCPFPS